MKAYGVAVFSELQVIVAGRNLRSHRTLCCKEFQRYLTKLLHNSLAYQHRLSKKSLTSEGAVHRCCVGVTIQNRVDTVVRGSRSQEEEGEKEGEKALKGSLWWWIERF